METVTQQLPAGEWPGGWWEAWFLLWSGPEVQPCERLWDQEWAWGEGLRWGGRNVLRTESEGQQHLRKGLRRCREGGFREAGGKRKRLGLWGIEKCGCHTAEAMASLAGAVRCRGLKSELETCRVK